MFQYFGRHDFLIKFELVKVLVIFVIMLLKINLEVGNDLLVVHTLTIGLLIEVLVGFHEEFWELVEGQLVLKMTNVVIILLLVVLMHHRINLVHTHALLKQLIVSLNFQGILETDFTQFLDDFRGSRSFDILLRVDNSSLAETMVEIGGNVDKGCDLWDFGKQIGRQVHDLFEQEARLFIEL